MTDAALITAAATKHRLDPLVVLALVHVESGGNTYAYRPETAFRWMWDCRQNRPFRALTPDEARSKVPPPDFTALTGNPQQEWTAQQASFGLCQVMGAVARELGFRGPFLLELVDPQLNLDLACRLLAGHLVWAKGDISKALGAFNAGRGGATSAAGLTYSAKVLARKKSLQVQP